MKEISKLISLKHLKDTEFFGIQIGANLRGGEIIELSGDLGAGKTTLAKSIVAGTGSLDHVSSPTFVVSKLYKAPTFDIHHYDLYRLDDADLIASELSDHVGTDSSVTLIEWGNNFPDIMPGSRAVLFITALTEHSRNIRIVYPESLEYIFGGIK